MNPRPRGAMDDDCRPGGVDVESEEVSEAPERIWAAEDECGNPWWSTARDDEMDEYLRADLAAAQVAELVEALRGLMEYARDPVVPSEHGIIDAPTLEQWRHFNANYVRWVVELSKREIAARAILAKYGDKT